MRGSVYYQASVLAKIIFSHGAKKEDRINKSHTEYKCVASYKTMETYLRVWNNFGLFLRDEFGIKDFQKTTPQHIENYMLQKIDTASSKQYLEKISSALGKLEHALTVFSIEINGCSVKYDFSIRQCVLDSLRDEGMLTDGYHNRAYESPELIIEHLDSFEHKLGAKIQLTGNARFEGIGLIKKQQLKGKKNDPISNKERYIIQTKEKGGKVGDISISKELYSELEGYLIKYKVFKLDYQQYAKNIRQTCKTLGIKPEGTHGFRWCFAQRRIREYQSCGYNYDQALQGVSWEMKHNRANISEHYLGL